MSSEPVSEKQEAGAQLDHPRSKALLFKMLTVLWIFPTAGAVWIWFTEWDQFRGRAKLSGTWPAMVLEQWVALVLVLLHTVFLALASYYSRKERGLKAPQ